MASRLIMAMGLDYMGSDEGQKKEPASVKAILQKVNPSLSIRDIEKNKGILIFKSYEEAEELVKNLYEYSSDTNKSTVEERKLCFYIVIIGDPEEDQLIFATTINLLNSIMEEKNEKMQFYPVQVYITKDVYQSLAPTYQDLYHSLVEVANHELHQRFSEDAQRCFVVSPIGEENSEIRKRADHIFERYIKQACETTPFRAVRGEMMRGNRITPEIIEALQSDPMVVIYLGNPKWGGWNPNVMYELGIREANAGPYVVIKDSTSEGKPYNLPFDLKDSRTVEVPEEEDDNPDSINSKIRTIRDRIIVPGPQWDYLYPGATIDIKIGDPSDEGISKFTDASKELETLFELKGIVGREASSIIKHLLERMPPFQRQPFADEQGNLIARLLVPILGVGNVHATVPIVFQEHQQYKGRAFLPIIVRYSFNKLTSFLRLRILYIDVTSATKLDEKKGYYICALTGNGKIDLSSSTKSLEQRAG